MFVRKSWFQFFALSALMASLSVAGGCSKKDAKDDVSSVPTAAQADENASGDSDNGNAMGLQTVHFPYDSFELSVEGKRVLDANAAVLKDKASLKVQIEGHCDIRGGIQYNLALGEKRANAAKKYLVGKGISADRITVISFGKEKPVDAGTSEEAHSKNRRGNFVITAR